MSIYESIGGETVVARAVEEFYTKLTSDPIASVFFEETDGARLEALAPLRLEIVTAPAEGSDDWGALDPTGGSG